MGRQSLHADHKSVDYPQPWHIRLASNLGLGICNFTSPKGQWYTINHRVVELT